MGAVLEAHVLKAWSPACGGTLGRTFRMWGLVGKRHATGGVLLKETLALHFLLSFCFMAITNEPLLVSHFHRDGAAASLMPELRDHGLKPQKSWSKINLSSLWAGYHLGSFVAVIRSSLSNSFSYCSFFSWPSLALWGTRVPMSHRNCWDRHKPSMSLCQAAFEGKDIMLT